jgi:hypothetical protein
MHEGIVAYIETGRPVGGFLTALLSNDLMGAFGKADLSNQHAMLNWATYLYNAVPSGCFGSPKRVKAWQDHNGLAGKAVQS